MEHFMERLLTIVVFLCTTIGVDEARVQVCIGLQALRLNSIHYLNSSPLTMMHDWLVVAGSYLPAEEYGWNTGVALHQRSVYD